MNGDNGRVVEQPEVAVDVSAQEAKPALRLVEGEPVYVPAEVTEGAIKASQMTEDAVVTAQRPVLDICFKKGAEHFYCNEPSGHEGDCVFNSPEAKDSRERYMLSRLIFGLDGTFTEQERARRAWAKQDLGMVQRMDRWWKKHPQAQLLRDEIEAAGEVKRVVLANPAQAQAYEKATKFRVVK